MAGKNLNLVGWYQRFIWWYWEWKNLCV